MRLKEVAERLTSHLKRMEADPEINRTLPPKHTIPELVRPFAYATGRYIAVIYQSWRALNPTHLSKAEALAYLGWLEAGNNGSHYDAALTIPDNAVPGMAGIPDKPTPKPNDSHKVPQAEPEVSE